MDKRRSSNRRPASRPKKTTGSEQGILAWSTYQDTLKELDKSLMIQLQKTMSSLRITFLLNITIYALIFIILVGAFLYGSKPALSNSGHSSWGGAIAITSLILLGIMVFRSPVREFTQIARDLARIQIILQGYNRQLNQVDATFKQAVLSGALNITMLNKSLEYLQQVIDRNVESITNSMEDINL